MLTAQTWGIKAWQESDTAKISSLGAKGIGGSRSCPFVGRGGGKEIT